MGYSNSRDKLQRDYCRDKSLESIILILSPNI